MIRAIAASVLVWTAVGSVSTPQAHDSTPHGLAVLPLFERTAEFDYDPPEPGSYELPALGRAGDGYVLDSTGAKRRLRDVLKGKITLFSPIYTLCGDANGCPLATSVLLDIFDASARDPDLARNLRLASLSFDPPRDTPEALAAYAAPLLAAARGGTKSDWVFLTAESERALAPILRGFDQPVARVDSAAGTALAHVLYVYLVDRDGRIRNVYTLAFLDPRLIVADIKTLLLEIRRAERR